MEGKQTQDAQEKIGEIKVEYKYSDRDGWAREGSQDFIQIGNSELPLPPIWARKLDFYVYSDNGNFAFSGEPAKGLEIIKKTREWVAIKNELEDPSEKNRLDRIFLQQDAIIQRELIGKEKKKDEWITLETEKENILNKRKQKETELRVLERKVSEFKI